MVTVSLHYKYESRVKWLLVMAWMSHLNLPCFQELVGVVYIRQVRKTMTPTPELQHCVRGYHLYMEEGELPLGKSPRVKRERNTKDP